MAEAYYSTVFEHSAEAVWRVIRDFNNYPVWVDGAGSSEIEDGKTGEVVGAVRTVLYDGRRLRQRLLALSDIEHAQTYAFAEEAAAPVANYQATLRVTPIIDGDRAFVEWRATFDCEPSSVPARCDFFQNAFADWLESLRRHLQRQAKAA
jgi:hypothetical protein